MKPGKLPSLKSSIEIDFESACQCEGFLKQKSPNFLRGWQQRYFKIIDTGQLLTYFDKKPTEKDKPKDFIRIIEIKKIYFISDTQFEFEYKERIYKLRAPEQYFAEKWISSIISCRKELKKEANTSFKIDGSALEEKDADLKSSFSTVQSFSSRNSFQQDIPEAKPSKISDLVQIQKELENANVPKDQWQALEKASESRLEKLEIQKNMEVYGLDQLKDHIIYGFMLKKNQVKGAEALTIAHPRFYLMFSTVSLNQKIDYLDNQFNLKSCDWLPDNWFMDTLYYFNDDNEMSPQKQKKNEENEENSKIQNAKLNDFLGSIQIQHITKIEIINLEEGPTTINPLKMFKNAIFKIGDLTGVGHATNQKYGLELTIVKGDRTKGYYFHFDYINQLDQLKRAFERVRVYENQKKEERVGAKGVQEKQNLETISHTISEGKSQTIVEEKGQNEKNLNNNPLAQKQEHSEEIKREERSIQISEEKKQNQASLGAEDSVNIEEIKENIIDNIKEDSKLENQIKGKSNPLPPPTQVSSFVENKKNSEEEEKLKNIQKQSIMAGYCTRNLKKLYVVLQKELLIFYQKEESQTESSTDFWALKELQMKIDQKQKQRFITVIIRSKKGVLNSKLTFRTVQERNVWFIKLQVAKEFSDRSLEEVENEIKRRRNIGQEDNDLKFSIKVDSSSIAKEQLDKQKKIDNASYNSDEKNSNNRLTNSEMSNVQARQSDKEGGDQGLSTFGKFQVQFCCCFIKSGEDEEYDQAYEQFIKNKTN